MDEMVKSLILTLRLARGSILESNVSLSLRAMGGDLHSAESLVANNKLIRLFDITLNSKEVAEIIKEIDTELANKPVEEDDEDDDYVSDTVFGNPFFPYPDEDKETN